MESNIINVLLQCILFSVPPKPIKEGKKHQRSVPVVCTNGRFIYRAVPLLLRLSNDIEESPGPRTINDIVDPAYTVHGDFNQGSELMFGMNASKECVAMSLCAIVYKEIKSVNSWDRLMLNTILICGNLYGIISQSIFESYLLLTDVPELVDVENHAFNLQYSDSFSGALHINEDSHPYVTLEHAFSEVFVSLHYNSCLLTIGMNTVAILMPFPGVFKVLDSHSRDVFGRPSPLVTVF